MGNPDLQWGQCCAGCCVHYVFWVGCEGCSLGHHHWSGHLFLTCTHYYSKVMHSHTMGLSMLQFCRHTHSITRHYAKTYMSSDELSMLCAVCICPTGCLSMHSLHGPHRQQILHCVWCILPCNAARCCVFAGTDRLCANYRL